MAITVVGAALIRADPAAIAVLEPAPDGTPGPLRADRVALMTTRAMFIAKHRSAGSNRAYWELPGGPVENGDERSTLQQQLKDEFSVDVDARTAILPTRDIFDYRPFLNVDVGGDKKIDAQAGADTSAVLQVWITQLGMGIPPGLLDISVNNCANCKYEECAWVMLGDLTSVDWRQADGMTVPEIIDYYLGDPEWKTAVAAGS